jgi:hypothetical protein
MRRTPAPAPMMRAGAGGRRDSSGGAWHREGRQGPRYKVNGGGPRWWRQTGSGAAGGCRVGVVICFFREMGPVGCTGVGAEWTGQTPVTENF